MSNETSDYRHAYTRAKKELQSLLNVQQQTEKRLLVVRKSLETLKELCATEGINIEPSEEAASLIEYSTLADEIRTILKAHPGVGLRPHQLKEELTKLGHDLSQYQNPQATIHMILKRMVISKEVKEEISFMSGKQTYMWIWRFPRIKTEAEALNATEGTN
jgi:hypothetical protein